MGNLSFVDIIKQHTLNGIGCLDTRSIESFKVCHLNNSTHINETELEQRLFELPPKQISFLLISHSNESSKILNKYGWNEFIQINLSSEQWKLLKSDYNELISSDNVRYIPLFHPCPLLSSHIDNIEASLYKNHKIKANDIAPRQLPKECNQKPFGYSAVSKTSQSVASNWYNPMSSNNKKQKLIPNNSIKHELNNESVVLRACDIGCGSGRDSIWLSLRNLHKNIKWNVECIDFNHKMLSRLKTFSLNACVSDKIFITKSKIRGDDKLTLYRNINQNEPFAIYDLNQMAKNEEKNEYYFEKEYDLILCVRFLERTLIYKLWKMGKMIKLNGYLLMFQFMEGCEKFGHPKNKNRMLKKDELAKAFGDNQRFRILVDQQVQAEYGRPMQAFLCQRIS